MSVAYEVREIQHTERTRIPVRIVCDCCGADALYPAHNRAHAEFSRIQDDGWSNRGILNLDLCEECKKLVIDLLIVRAATFERTLPQTREEILVT